MTGWLRIRKASCQARYCFSAMFLNTSNAYSKNIVPADASFVHS